MKIKVRFFTSLREITGKKEDEIQSPSIFTVEELLAHLSKKYGREFTEYLYDEKGKVRTYIQILINGRGIKALQGFETKLKEGDTVAIFPPVGGG
ncbi:MAG: MoaD/ThiS family protein [Candidatus Bathyarchaeota archaeon]|jgi:molybdopterin synthase sulfur carrier subunit|nr:MoaD/ThiS family protein [Candidatus Bathyarchaeota archaeon]MDH5701272.1 MoaD/ThiS family protein [Candidatus Bathyarchaeota archaeon]